MEVVFTDEILIGSMQFTESEVNIRERFDNMLLQNWNLNF